MFDTLSKNISVDFGKKLQEMVVTIMIYCGFTFLYCVFIIKMLIIIKNYISWGMDVVNYKNIYNLENDYVYV